MNEHCAGNGCDSRVPVLAAGQEGQVEGSHLSQTCRQHAQVGPDVLGAWRPLQINSPSVRLHVCLSNKTVSSLSAYWFLTALFRDRWGRHISTKSQESNIDIGLFVIVFKTCLQEKRFDIQITTKVIVIALYLFK